MPETKAIVRAPYCVFGQIVVAVRDHYIINQLPYPANLPALIEEYTCKEYPHLCDDGKRPKELKVPLGLMFAAVLQGTVTLVEHAMRGKVSQEEAEARSGICSGCSENQQVSCAGCQYSTLATVAEKIARGGRTSHDKELFSCAVCLCALRAKIWVQTDVLKKHMTEKQMAALPDHCWLKKEAA